MAYSYTQPVTQALKGVHTGPTTGGRVICVPESAAPAPKSKPVPDMRLRPSDLRKLQDLGFLPPPSAGFSPSARVGGLNVKRIEHGKTSTWLLPGAAAQPTPQQSLADEDEVEGQSQLKAKPSGLLPLLLEFHNEDDVQDQGRLAAKAPGLRALLLEFQKAHPDWDKRFMLRFSPALLDAGVAAAGSVIVMSVPEEDQANFGAGMQELLDYISGRFKSLPLMLLHDSTLAFAPFNLTGASQVDVRCASAESLKANQRYRENEAALNQIISDNMPQPPKRPWPPKNNEEFIRFYTEWAFNIDDRAQRELLLGKIKKVIQLTDEIRRSLCKDWEACIAQHLSTAKAAHSLSLHRLPLLAMDAFHLPLHIKWAVVSPRPAARPNKQ